MSNFWKINVCLMLLLMIGCSVQDAAPDAAQESEVAVQIAPTDVPATATVEPEPTATMMPSIADGMTQEEIARAMVRAAQSNKLEDVAAFLEAGADPNAINLSSGMAAVHFATVRNNLEMFTLLHEAGADINAVNYAGETLMHIAATHNGFEVAQQAMTLADYDLESRRTEFGFTPLLAAAFLGNVEMVELLIDSGANIEAADDWGDTAVNVAAYSGHLTTIETLIALGALPAVENSSGGTAVTHAQSNNYPDVVAYLESLIEQ